MPSGTSQLPGPISKAVATIIFDSIASHGGLSQAAVARDAGMSTSQLSRVLNGHKVFTLEELDRVCAALGLELSEVVDHADQASRMRRRLAPVTPIGGNVGSTNEAGIPDLARAAFEDDGDDGADLD
ncbi:helix-turn-helix transcriptional regulator [Leucobacter sp. CSA1]|uniref:Helix-turn-helix transcriptional regulator n=1 Tax=Leucobacter chromiisoli TaxID=2796471 RepID=A0A934UWY6_9MICO|nr:helix-turn-helix transcriptional regulator [Leucobacter chromiisoli]MBK0420392.1 helix-turn-helix transcriptional regulator [Leucobacter chromiisoli]